MWTPFHTALWGILLSRSYFEAALMVWLMGKSVFRFCQSFTSFTDTVQKLGTLLNRYYLS